MNRIRIRQALALALLAAALMPAPRVAALTITSVTSGNGLPAFSVQWTDSAGLPRTAIMVKQSAAGPGYLYQMTYQVGAATRVCVGDGSTGYPGDGFVQNHTAAYGDYNSLDQNVPGTTTTVLSGPSHAIIEFNMPTYAIAGVTIPTTIYWFFADGRSHPVFALSQDARATAGNIGANTRSPYGSLNFDGAGGNSAVGGASYGDTLKFVTLATNPEQVTGLSPWADTLPNTIPYVMEWVDPSEVDAEMGHVATVPITVQDQGGDRDVNSTYDPRNREELSGPMIPYGPSNAQGDTGPDAWAFQSLDYIFHPDWSGDTQAAGASIQVSYSKLAWGSNFGKLGGYNAGNSSLDPTQYWQHSDSGGNINTGIRASGMLLAYSVFVVLGTHSGAYTNGAVGQEVAQMENAALAQLSASTGTVKTSGPTGVGNAASASLTYTPAGYNPIYATWELVASGNAVNATLTPPAGKTLDHPVFVLNNYTANTLPATLSVGTGLATAGVDYFATLDTAGQRLWITVNRATSSPVNLIVSGSGSGGQAPVITSIPASGYAGSTITITGQNFGGATAVTFNGLGAGFTVISATQISATVPAGAASGKISVTTPDGTATSTTTFTVLAAPPSLTIYDDTLGLVNGFQDYSWTTVNDFNTAPIYSGTYSISVSGTAYNALSLYNPSAFATSGYANLSFWINGGAAGASGVQVMGVVGTAYAAIFSLPTLAPDAWQHFTIPLSTLGVANITDCNGFWFWPTAAGTTTFYVADVQLVAAASTPITLRPLQPQPKAGSLVLQLSGAPGQSCVIATSTNLANWTNVSTNVLAGSSLLLTNAITPSVPHQFWKATGN